MNLDRMQSSVFATRLACVGMVALALVSMPAGLEAQQEPKADPSAAVEEETKGQAKKDKKKKNEAGSEKKEPQKGPSFIPIPIFITEPAIGYGLGAALAYFHPTKDGEAGGSLAPGLTTSTASATGKRQKVPPTISGIAAAYTDKGTWGVGLGHSASWAKDTIRYSGVIGYANVVSEFWFLNRPFEFTLAGAVLTQDIKFRLGKGNFFLGGKLSWLDTDVKVKVDIDDVPIDLSDREVQDLGLALQAAYEGRDNMMTPNSGQYVHLTAWKYFESQFSDFAYLKAGLDVQSFHPLAADKLVLGLRLKLDAVDGEPPFWAYPWITLRGVAALRYQNERTAVIDSELRWNFAERWAAVGFLGTGATEGDAPQYVDEKGITAGGIGGRYLYRPQDSLWVGVDLARGPEETIFYIQVGHAW
jgi:hypothetical protein